MKQRFPKAKRMCRGLARSAFLTSMMLLASIATAVASCGLDKHPTYSDITAVRYEETSCLGKCPSYEVLFSDLGAYYVGRRWVQMTGTYQAETPSNGAYLAGNLPRSLRQAVQVLERYNFFDLNVETDLVTDVPHYIVAVQRCGVTTKLDWAAYGKRRDIEDLFDALDAITNGVHWTKTSDSDESPLNAYAAIYP